MKNRICHVTSIHNRYDTRIFQKECRSLVEAGYEVYILVNDNFESEIKDGVHIVSTGFLPRNRMERFVKLKSKMFHFMSEINAEIYHFHDPDLIPIGLQIKRKKKNVKIVFDSHEDVPAQIMNKDWIPFFIRGVISKTFGVYQRVELKKYDYIIGVTPALVEKLSKINRKVSMITNYPILDVLNKQQNKDYLLRKNVICFAGGIDEQWCHETILEAIEGIDVEYTICGPSTNEYINRLKKLPEWEKVNYLGRISYEEAREEYNKARAGMAILKYNPNANGKQGTMGNTKLFECMQAGVPVICTDFVLWKEIVEKNNCGICVNPYDAMQVRNAIQYLLDNPTEAVNMGNNGKQLIYEKYNWSTQEKVLKEIYRFLLERN